MLLSFTQLSYWLSIETGDGTLIVFQHVKLTHKNLSDVFTPDESAQAADC